MLTTVLGSKHNVGSYSCSSSNFAFFNSFNNYNGCATNIALLLQSVLRQKSFVDEILTIINPIVSREHAQTAIYTCLGPVAITPKLQVGTLQKHGNDFWELLI